MIKTDTFYLEQVKGNTYCIVTAASRIPLYKLDEKNVILLDSGIGKLDTEPLMKLLDEQGFHVQAAMATHFHPDHVGNHPALKEKYGATLYMTPYASVMCSDNLNMCSCFMSSSYRSMQNRRPDLCKADVFIGEEGPLEVCGAEFQVLQLPGHAPEHIGIVTPDQVAYLGDAVLSSQVLSMMRMPYTTCCEPDIESKQKIRQLPYHCYIMAHNGVVEDIRPTVDENLEKMYSIMETVEQLADHYMSLEQLALTVMEHYEMDKNNRRKVGGANRNVKTYVDYLMDMGRLVSKAEDGRIQYVRKDLA